MAKVTRRNALKRIGAATAVLGGSAALGTALWDEGGIGIYKSAGAPQTRDFRLRDKTLAKADIAIAKQGVEAAILTRAAIDALGGMEIFVSRGDRVTIKPNIGWDRTPIHAANTNPVVVAELVKMAYDAGAELVTVTDASCNEPGRCFQRSGIWKSAYDAGADVVLPAEHRLRDMRLGGTMLDDWPRYRP